MIGSAGTKAKCDWVKELGFDHVFNYKETTVDEALKQMAPDGIDMHFDNVSTHINLHFDNVSTHIDLYFDNLSTHIDLHFDNVSTHIDLHFDNVSTHIDLHFDNVSSAAWPRKHGQTRSALTLSFLYLAAL